MKTFTIQLPESVKIDEQDAKTMFASALYQRGVLSVGQAAFMAGYTKSEFMEILGNYGISVFSYNDEELEKDLQNAKNYRI